MPERLTVKAMVVSINWEGQAHMGAMIVRRAALWMVWVEREPLGQEYPY